MNLKTLIENQRIRIDSHYAGVDKPINFADVHIHKEFLDRKRRGGWIRIYLNGEKIEFANRFKYDERSKILSEIKNVLKSKYVLEQLANDVADAFYRWSSKDITMKQAREYAKKIAQHFGLKKNIVEEFINYVEGALMQYLSIHSDEDNKKYWILQCKEFIAVGPGKVKLLKGFRQKKRD